jgi:Domain of Unknown Function (DUF1080)
MAVAMAMVGGANVALAQVDTTWPQHSMDRPRPAIVDPGPYVPTGRPPSDAVVLLNGHDLSNWETVDSGGKPARWKVTPAYIEVVGGTGDIATRQRFGDCQIHVEWATPTPAKGEGQERGNSGVYLAGLYEVQVLDSYDNPTYADGQAAAMYGEFPPLVNVSRPPGQWQTYDIVFHGPRFGPDSAVIRPARVTVFHNGVLVQDNVALSGPTANKRRPPYHVTPDAMPLRLQDHGYPVRFRNIWIRELHD